jgi:outer membrane biosynthesis protein TonB
VSLWEFLRQWQGSRHATGITLSVLVHALVLAALFTNNPFFAMRKPATKPGDALIVDLKSDPSPAAPGNTSPPAPPRSPAPRARAAAAPPSPSARPAPVKPAPALAKPEPVPAKPEPPQEAPSRVASAPPSPPVPPPPQPVAPPVTETAGTIPAPAAPVPPAPSMPPTPSAPADTAARSSEPPPSPSAPASGAERQVASVPPAATAPMDQPYVPDLRSLRPGAGGAHGLAGAGRGGIEGDPVALDNADPRYGEYLARVKLAIERNMIYPCVKDPHGRVCEYKPAHLLIEFGIKRDGALAFIQVRQSAAYQIFDDVSQNAVKLAVFPPMPEVLRRIHPTGLPIVARFRYETTLSLNSIVR